MIVYIHYENNDNSCSDPECCGGPNPAIYLSIFSSIEKAQKAGIKVKDLEAVLVDDSGPTFIPI